VRFSNTSRLYVIARATPEEARLLWNSSKEMADFKCRFAITVRKTWQVLNDTEIHPADKEVLLYNCMGMEHHISPEATRERRAKHAQAVLEAQARQRKLGYDDEGLEIGKISSVSSKKTRKRAHSIALLYHQLLSKGR